MKVSLRTFMPIAAAGMLSLVSCDTVTDRAKRYMSEYNHSMNDLNEILMSENPQSKLDSIAYRNIFNSTQAAKDSAKVTEFNKIASKMRGNKDGGNWSRFVDINDKLIEENISIKDFYKIEETDTQLRSDPVRINIRQHFADDWAYRKFFEKAGIMNDNISQKCDEVSKRIRP